MLGELADPARYTAPLEITNWDPAALLRQLKTMLLIRFAEERIAELVNAGQARCPCHLAIGQEAIAVGVSENLRDTDRVFGTHRSHPHFLALGLDVRLLLDEVLGKVTGCSRGMGGSMHLYGRDKGFMGSVPIVGATIPLAVGAALAARKDQSGDVAIAYFGDGATEEGVLHECLNFASYYQLPVIFVCENNLFSSHLHIRLRQPSDSVSRFAAAHQIPYRIVDGNDVLEVARISADAISAARDGQGPFFLEAVTFRWRGHVGPNEDIDVGIKRSAEDLELWKKRDPVRRLSTALVAAGQLTDRQLSALEDQLRETVAQASQAAEHAPYPDASQLHAAVYAGGHSHQNGSGRSPSRTRRSPK